MTARDSLERETREVHVPDGARELAHAIGSRDAEPPRARVLEDPESRREASADLRQRVEGDRETRRFEAPRDELARFNPQRAGLPAMTPESAAEHINRNRASRPWLAMTDSASPEAGRIIAAADAAHGHGHIRHEGWVTEEANRRRVAYLEDPAQLDPEKRHQGIDGLRQDDQPHRIGDMATRITDPDAFATAFARAVTHPAVREALDTTFDPASRPDRVTIPIAELLGPGGHRYCTGWQLESVDGDTQAARRNRSSWVSTTSGASDMRGPEPKAVPVPTFAGGDMLFAFTRNNGEQRYEIVTMFPRPPQSAEGA